MTAGYRLHDLLIEAKRQAGSTAQLARKLGVTDKAVSHWLKLDNKGLAQSMQTANVQALLDCSEKRLKIELALFRAAPLLWDPHRSYTENIATSMPPPPESIPPTPSNLNTLFLGHNLRSPFGASSSVATATPSRIRYVAATGADVITMKTVRPIETPSHTWPNLFACHASCRRLTTDHYEDPQLLVDIPDNDFFKINHGIVNRYGMPSPPPEEWAAQYSRANTHLSHEQLLILSVTTFRTPTDRRKNLIDGFQRTLEIAAQNGIGVVELNLSCPNCTGIEGDVYRDTATAKALLRSLRKDFPDLKLIAKIGYLPATSLRPFLIETAAFIDGIAAINSVAVAAQRQGQEVEPAFGGHLPGLSGRPILSLGLDCIRNINTIRDEERLDKLKIIGMGGVSSPADVLNYLNQGADVVQATTAYLIDPLFGLKVRSHLAAHFQNRPLTLEQEVELARAEWARAASAIDKEFPARPDRNEAALAIWNRWERDHRETFRAGPRRGGRIDSNEFCRRIRRTMLQQQACASGDYK